MIEPLPYTHIVISDAHLPHDQAQRSILLQQFLATLRPAPRTLIIAGDLFDFWVGNRPGLWRRHRKVIDRLTQLVAAGTRVIYLEGNHDFNLPFAKLGIKVYSGPIDLQLDGIPLHIAHGDLIDTDDIGYRALYRLSRSPLIKVADGLLPDSIVFGITNRLTDHRTANRKPCSPDLWEKFAGYAREIVADRGARMVILGHAHRAALTRIATDVGQALLVNAGDWISNATFIGLHNETVELVQYPTGERLAVETI